MENLTYSCTVSERAIRQIHVMWSKYLFQLELFYLSVVGEQLGAVYL